MTGAARYKLSKHVQLADADSGAILLDTRRGAYWQLNVTSARIVQLLTEGATTDEVVDRLTEETDAPRSRISHDVTAATAAMRKAGFIARERR